MQRRLEALVLVARRVYEGRQRADRRSKKTGSGIEFADHREYVPGDDFRSLDWNVYQRTGRLLVRLFEEEEDLSVYLLIDTSRSMRFGSPAKLRYAKQLGAALAYVALAHLDRVSMLTFDTRVAARLAPTRGKGRIFKVFDFLRPLHADGETSLSESMRRFAAQNKRRGVAVLISDLYDPAGFEAGIDQLRFARFETHVLHLVDAADRRPAVHGDVEIVDAETGESRAVTVSPRVLRRYEEAYDAYLRRVERFCADKQVFYERIDTRTPFDAAVLDVLRRGGVVR